MKKYKRKIKAASGVQGGTDAWGTAAQDAIAGGTLGGTVGSLVGPEGTVIGAAAGALIGGVYGYFTGSAEDKAKRNLYKPHTKAINSSNASGKALGSVSGAYSNISLTPSTSIDPAQESKLQGLQDQNSLVVGLAGGATSTIGGMKSAGMFKPTGGGKGDLGNLNLGKELPFQTNAPNMKNSVMPTGPTSTMTDSIQYNPPSYGNMPYSDELNSLMGNIDPIQQNALAGGGKNQKNATPVEAEGGEIEVAFDDNYGIVSKKAITGPSHAAGGVDMKLPKNHAILNKEQQGRLAKGESLKSILDSVPNVHEAEKAQNGATDPPKKFNLLDPKSWSAETETTKSWDEVAKGINIYPSVGETPKDAVSGTGEMGKMPYHTYVAPQIKGNVPNTGTTPPEPTVAVTSPPEMSLTGTSTDRGDVSKMLFSMPKKSATLSPGGTEITYPMKDQEEKVENKPFQSLINETPQKEGFKWGYAENKSLSDLASNLMTIFQPRAQGVNVQGTRAGTPTMVTARYQNPKTTLDEVGRQVKAGVEKLTQTGRSDMIPSLMSGAMEATNKVGEQYAGMNQQAESAAQAENAKSSNQFSLTQAGMDAETAKEQAYMELQTLQQRGLQDTERYKALMNLINAYPAYDKLKQDDQMRRAVYARTMTNMYSGK